MKLCHAGHIVHICPEMCVSLAIAYALSRPYISVITHDLVELEVKPHNDRHNDIDEEMCHLEVSVNRCCDR